ncbi:MAG TPA: hypothetical protein VK816_10220 [Jatrophihabitantaceae bacterium]|jgi:hypothetical protein|nr:hypothetical protein [Jatrophihabitantaceae bacterium]
MLSPQREHSSGRHRSSGRRAPLALVGGGLLLAILITAAAIGLAGSRDPSKPPSATPQPSPHPINVSAASSWAAVNLGSSARILADPAGTTSLLDAGVPADVVGPISALAYAKPPASGCDGFAFVLDTPELNTAAARDTLLAMCLSSSLPVALFGTGTGGVAIREVYAGELTALRRQLATDASARRIAGDALLVNPSLSFASQPRSVVARGALDLRAATVLAALATHTPVTVSQVTESSAEVAADRPARTIQLTVRDADALTSTLAGLSAPYQPEAIVGSGGAEVQLAWPVELAPVIPIS